MRLLDAILDVADQSNINEYARCPECSEIEKIALTALQAQPAQAQGDDVVERACDAFMSKITVDGNGGIEFLEEGILAALAAMPQQTMKPADIIEAIQQMLERGRVTLDNEGYLVAIPPKVEAPAADEEIIDAMVMAYQETTDCGCSEDGMKAVLSMLRECLSHPTAETPSARITDDKDRENPVEGVYPTANAVAVERERCARIVEYDAVAIGDFGLRLDQFKSFNDWHKAALAAAIRSGGAS